MQILEAVKNSYLVVPIVIFITLLAVFIDSKVNNKDTLKEDYINASLFTGLIAAILVFINTENITVKSDPTILKGPAPF